MSYKNSLLTRHPGVFFKLRLGYGVGIKMLTKDQLSLGLESLSVGFHQKAIIVHIWLAF